MFRIESNEDNPPLPNAQLVEMQLHFRGDDKACGHWMHGTLPTTLDTKGAMLHIGMRVPRADFTTPAICAVRTSRRGNFIGWEKIEPGTTVTVGQLKLTSL